jgi:hypothetical protein
MDEAQAELIVRRSLSRYYRSTSVAATAETEVMFFDS